MTKEEFAKELYALMLSKGKEPSKVMATVWYEDLKGIPDDKLRAAFQKLRHSASGFPNVGQIFEMVNPSIDLDAEAERAWADAENGCGYSRNAYVSNVVEQLGGPDVIGYADYDFELPRIKKRFITLYKDLIKNTPNYVALPLPKVKRALPEPEKKELPCTPEEAEKNKAKVAEIISTIGEKRI